MVVMGRFYALPLVRKQKLTNRVLSIFGFKADNVKVEGENDFGYDTIVQSNANMSRITRRIKKRKKIAL